jgi:hypothetical protein
VPRAARRGRLRPDGRLAAGSGLLVARGGVEWFQAPKSRSSWRSTISATCCGSRSAAVSPPPSGYLMTPAYRTVRQPSPAVTPAIEDL